MNPPPESLPSLALEYINEHGLIGEGDHVLVGVSGGPDSVALLGVLADLKEDLSIARITVLHFDHRLRGKESDRDREFVRNLALSAGFDFHCAEADVRDFAAKSKISVEMAARECRRSFFFKAVRELKGDEIALGHTADDQAEEVLLRILRGTGPAGIQAMSPSTEARIIRPLLFAVRADILKYLQESDREYRTDSSNFDPSCQRNFLRLKVFPLLKEAFNPQIVRTITRCADLAREEEAWLEPQVLLLWEDACLLRGEGWYVLSCQRLKELHHALLRRILRLAISRIKGNLSGVGLVHVETLVELVRKRGKTVELPGGIEAIGQGEGLYIGLKRGVWLEDLPLEPLTISTPGGYVFGRRKFELRVEEAEGFSKRDYHGDCGLMDMAKLKWPLQLRFQKPGDRFQPLGMKGTKKLQDFFTDCKAPRSERRRIPLLCDSEKICWVVGMRIDDRVKVASDTKQVLVVKSLDFPAGD